MKTWELAENNSEWEVLAETPRTQGAMMTIPPGGSEGGPDNKHPNSDQWLFVLSGSGWAIVEGKQILLGAGTLLLIEAGECHEIKSDPNSILQTANFYGPKVEFEAE